MAYVYIGRLLPRAGDEAALLQTDATQVRCITHAINELADRVVVAFAVLSTRLKMRVGDTGAAIATTLSNLVPLSGAFATSGDPPLVQFTNNRLRCLQPIIQVPCEMAVAQHVSLRWIDSERDMAQAIQNFPKADSSYRSRFPRPGRIFGAVGEAFPEL